MTWKDYLKTFQTYSVNLRGVAGPYPFWYQIKFFFATGKRFDI